MKTLREYREAAERAAIAKALQETGGDRTDAASLLGVTERTLYRKLNKYEDLRPTNLGFGASGSGEGLISSLMDD